MKIFSEIKTTIIETIGAEIRSVVVICSKSATQKRENIK